MGYKVAIVGATGNVGRQIIEILAERDFPISHISALASRSSVGREVYYGNTPLRVSALEFHDFEDTDICFISAGSAVSKQWVPRIVNDKCVVIDNSSAWRYYSDVPLIVPEVNPHDIVHYKKRHIIANPNCVAIPLVMALKCLHDIAKVKRVSVASYQSVSGAGKFAMDELFSQANSYFTGMPAKTQLFDRPIAFNLIPQIGDLMEDGVSKEEWKIVVETKKILDPKIRVIATAVRVPVFIGHSMAVHIEFAHPISAEDAKNALRNFSGCILSDDNSYATPRESAGQDSVYISRIREDNSVEDGLAMWIVTDNLRKGAALNAVQIAELLHIVNISQ